MKIRVGVVFGGRSGEHEISKRSAKAVIEHIDASKYEVIPIAITDEGHWLGPGSSVGLLAQEAARLVDTSSSDVPGEIAVIGVSSHAYCFHHAIDLVRFLGRAVCGDIVSVWPWLIHRHKKLWDDPDAFDPDRFAPERKAGRHRFQYLPFGAGPRRISIRSAL